MDSEKSWRFLLATGNNRILREDMRLSTLYRNSSFPASKHFLHHLRLKILVPKCLCTFILSWYSNPLVIPSLNDTYFESYFLRSLLFLSPHVKKSSYLTHGTIEKEAWLKSFRSNRFLWNSKIVNRMN